MTWRNAPDALCMMCMCSKTMKYGVIFDRSTDLTMIWAWPSASTDNTTRSSRRSCSSRSVRTVEARTSTSTTSASRFGIQCLCLRMFFSDSDAI